MTKPTLAQQISGTQHRGDYGVGEQLQQLTPPVKKVWSDFSKGFAAVAAPEETPEGASWDAADMEVDRRNRLVRAPGVSLVENLAYDPSDVMLHGNLNAFSELLLFAAPFVGFKSAAATMWVDKGLTIGRSVAAALYADVMLVTDGRKLWERRVGVNNLTKLSGPAGEDIAVFGTRVLIGGGIFNGNAELLSVQWNDADGDHTNWGGIGSGVEFLMSGGPEADRIVAMKVMNLNLLAIFTRHAIWVGSLTGNGLAPFSFGVRVKGVGCMSRRTVHATEYGVIFLSSDGVRAFDGNSSAIISDSINSELLPLVEDGKDYRGSYDATSHRYYLYVPDGPTYVLDLNKQRWYKWSRTFTGGVSFPKQVTQETWETALGTWATELGTWADLPQEEKSSRHLLLYGKLLGFEDRSVETSLGVAFYPHWTMPVIQPEDLTRLFRKDRVEIRSEGQAVVRFNVPDSTGAFVTGANLAITKDTLDTFYDTTISTGLGLGLQLEIRSGFPKISRAALHGRFQGLRQ